VLVCVVIFAAIIPGVCLIVIGSREPWNSVMFGLGMALTVPGALVVLVGIGFCCVRLWCW
jgi:hypothetical protein